MANLIRCRVMRRLVLLCTGYQYPIYRTTGFDGLTQNTIHRRPFFGPKRSFISLPLKYVCGRRRLLGTPISSRIILVPIVPNLYIWLIGPISGKAIGDLWTITGNHLGRLWKVWRNRLSPKRVGYRKSDRLLFLNMFKNSSRPKPVGPRSSWSLKGPLKVFLSCLPSGAFMSPLELSSTLGSFRILSAAQSAGDLA